MQLKWNIGRHFYVIKIKLFDGIWKRFFKGRFSSLRVFCFPWVSEAGYSVSKVESQSSLLNSPESQNTYLWKEKKGKCMAYISSWPLNILKHGGLSIGKFCNQLIRIALTNWSTIQIYSWIWQNRSVAQKLKHIWNNLNENSAVQIGSVM